MGQHPTQGLTAETRDLIAAVLEAIDIPYAASAGHEEVRARIMDERIMQLKVSLQHLAEAHDRGDRYMDEKFTDGLAYLREQLAGMPPTGYVTAEQARERTAAGASWTEAIRLDFKREESAPAAEPDAENEDERGGRPAPNACVTCGRDFTAGRSVIPNVPARRVGGVLLFACEGCVPDGAAEPTWCEFASVPHDQHHATVFYDERTACGAPITHGTPDVIRTVDVVQDDAGKRIEVSVYRGAVNGGRPAVLAFTAEQAARAARWWPSGIARGLADAARILAGSATVTAGAA